MSLFARLTNRGNDLVRTQAVDVHNTVSPHKRAVVIAYESMRSTERSITLERGRHSEGPTRTLRSFEHLEKNLMSRYVENLEHIHCACLIQAYRGFQDPEVAV